MITPERLKEILKEHRWTIQINSSGRQQTFAAKRRQGKRLVTCYIGTSNTLSNLAEEDIVAKINRKAASRTPGQSA